MDEDDEFEKRLLVHLSKAFVRSDGSLSTVNIRMFIPLVK